MSTCRSLGFLAVVIALAAGCDRESTPIASVGPSPLPSPGPAPPPAPPGATGPLAFVSDRESGGRVAIYLAREDGSGVARLVEGRSAAWAPDGRRLAVASHRGVTVINSDGTGARLIWSSRADSTDESPAWSPDGTRIAFTEYGTADGGILVMNSDGTGVTRLIAHAFVCEGCSGGDNGVSAPAWSPDGRRIAFQRFGYADFDSGIYVMNSDGSDPRPLLFGAFRPSWSPDGSTILFDTRMSIGLANADGSGRRLVVPTPGGDSYPTWTPDGAILFSGNNSESRRRIFIATTAGATRQVVPDLDAAPNPAYRDWGAVWAR
jgi:Tol biopolymer transport system component